MVRVMNSSLRKEKAMSQTKTANEQITEEVTS